MPTRLNSRDIFQKPEQLTHLYLINNYQEHCVSNIIPHCLPEPQSINLFTLKIHPDYRPSPLPSGQYRETCLYYM